MNDAPERIGLVSDGFGNWALAHKDEAHVAVHYTRAADHKGDSPLSYAPAVKVKALVWEERRNGYWRAKGTGYQIAHNEGDVYRVRLGGKVICRRIKFEKAKHWVFAHHSAAILAALEPALAVDPMSDQRVADLVESLKAYKMSESIAADTGTQDEYEFVFECWDRVEAALAALDTPQ